jgi:hypothetical protein
MSPVEPSEYALESDEQHLMGFGQGTRADAPGGRSIVTQSKILEQCKENANNLLRDSRADPSAMFAGTE